jgi:hypothetical protein
MFARVLKWWRRRSEADEDMTDRRIDRMTVARFDSSESGSIPPNYLPTGVDEGRPKK